MAEENFEGHEPEHREHHRTVGPHRAWCHSCGEWCYPQEPCGCCGPTAYEKLRQAARALVDATGRRCNVCTGWSPSWDGHSKNPPCEHQAREDLKALLDGS